MAIADASILLVDEDTGHTGMELSVAYSLDGKMLASGSKDNTIKLWDMPAAKKVDK